MKKTLIALTIAVVTLLTGAVATAGEDDAKQGDRAQIREKMIEKFDTDGDGKLNKDERAAAREARGGRKGREGRGQGSQGGPNPEQLFERFDADGDDHLSRAEFMELAEAMRKLRERMSPPREGGPREARRPRGDRPGPRREDADRPPRRPRGEDFEGDRFRPLQNRDSAEAEGRGRRRGDRARERGRDEGKGNQRRRGGPRGPEGRGPEGGPMGPPDPAKVFEDFDANGDNQLSLDEFKKLAEEMKARRGRQGRGEFGRPGPRPRGDSEGRPPRGKRRGRPGDDLGDADPSPEAETTAESQSV